VAAIALKVRSLPIAYATITADKFLYGKIMDRYRQFIVYDPQVMMGKPTIKGTRITVEFILESLAGGETPEQLMEAHPRLNMSAILAALAFAAEALKADVIYPVVEAVS